MNKAEFVNEVANNAEITKATARRVVDAVMEVMSQSLARNEDINLIGFGNFKTSERPSREGRNPQTGDKIHIPGGKVVRFKASKRLKERLNGQA
jgi:DNA-binding protein HU-beta